MPFYATKKLGLAIYQHRTCLQKNVYIGIHYVRTVKSSVKNTLPRFSRIADILMALKNVMIAYSS